MYPEYLLTPPEAEAFQRERTACIVGEKLASKYGFKIGDRLTLKGTIFPGQLGPHRPRHRPLGLPDADTNFLLFSWEYVNQRMGNSTRSGSTLLQIRPGAGDISRAVDATFANSPAETKTETEKAFQLGFITMLGNIQMVIMPSAPPSSSPSCSSR